MKTDIELLIEELNRLICYDDAPIMKGYLISIDKLLLKRTIEALEGLDMAYKQVKLELDTKEKTNRDFINSLSDESLANFLDAAINGSPCHLICNNYEKCLKNDFESVCVNHYIEWLKSKYEKEKYK